MMRRKRSKLKVFLISVLIFAVVGAGTVLGIQFFTKTGLFRIPGVVYYDESLDENELAILRRIFNEEVDLDKDVYISATNSLDRPILGEGEFLEEIYVPVTDSYSGKVGVMIENVEMLGTNIDPNLATNCGTEIEIGTNCIQEYRLIKIGELDNNKKLLKINNKYFLDSFDAGAVFRKISFVSEKYEEEIKPLVEAEFTKTFPDKDDVLTFAQTGVTALSRGMNTKLNSVGGDATYFAEKIGEFLSGFDLTHTSNESSFSSSANGSNICSNPKFVDTLIAIGLDIVELTGNHNQDCGDEAARETLKVYEENNIKTVGGGATATAAAVPLIIDKKDTNITMLAYNQSTGGATLDNTPGANQYYEDKAAAEIKAAKDRGDFVIVDIQYYECNGYDVTTESTVCDYADSSAGDQVGLFRHLIDLGADIVVGTSAHQPQTFELYGNGAIYYGLGNLFFDQIKWPGTRRSLVLVHYFYNGKLLQTRIVPTIYGNNMQTELLDEETAEWFVTRLANVRP